VTPKGFGASHNQTPPREKEKYHMTPQKLLINHPSSLLGRGWVLTLLVLGGFALCQPAQSAIDTPDPGGSLPVSNTADGHNALLSLTTGIYNSAFGFDALLSNGAAKFNTGVGGAALILNTADQNTAVGAGALLSNTTGANNTAVGTFAMFVNSTGPFNTAVGWQALINLNGPAGDNNANVAVGDLALTNLTSGHFNTAIGAAAGFLQTSGHNNVYIGQGSFGVDGENNTCYIQGIAGSSIPTANASFVFVDANTASATFGKLATVLVDADGNRVTVPISQSQLQAAPQGQPKASHAAEDGRQAMLNLKVEKLQATVAQQHKQIETLTVQLKEQAAQIQKVSAQLEVNKPAPQVVVNKP
jgi:hypothetical protein